MISIKELKKDNLDEFFQYLTIHLSENGQNNTALFQPLSKQQSILSNEWKSKFVDGFNKKDKDLGWRKIWAATNEVNKIVGHIDIRSYEQLNAEHRVLLGMGVESSFRNLKIGQKLLEFIIAYCRNNPKIIWLDLQVLANNIPAISLYKKMDFQQLGIIQDMFRIDGFHYNYCYMTLQVGN